MTAEYLTSLAGINTAYDILLLCYNWKHKEIYDSSLCSFPKAFIDKRWANIMPFLLCLTVQFCFSTSGFKASTEDMLGLSRKDGSAAKILI